MLGNLMSSRREGIVRDSKADSFLKLNIRYNNLSEVQAEM